MRLGVIAVVTMLLAACGDRDDAREPKAGSTEGGSTGMPETPAARTPAAPPANRRASFAKWELQSSGEGVALALTGAAHGTVMRLFCRSGTPTLLVNVPGFRPVGSEERMSFGSGGDVEALVADTGGDARRAGVSASGAVPARLAALVNGPVSVSYGAQVSGPHAAPPQKLARPFVAACNTSSDSGHAPSPAASLCMTQGAERLRMRPLRALGAEPFWAASIEGRCVTYSHPEDQDGTRIWTRYQASAGGGTWPGSLGGQRFKLRTRADPGCSDGMSDTRYPIEVDSIVGGERLSGCAQPVANS